MKKIASLLSSFAGILLVLSLTVSCQNFLSGSDLKAEIDTTIAYNNAANVSVLVKSEEGTGSTVPYGNYVAKAGYSFEVSFSENTETYKLIRWKAFKNNQEITDGVTIENADSYTAKVTLSNIEGVSIIPVCERRISIDGEPSPRYEANGVSRDRPIIVMFKKNPSESSFLFDENELPEGAVVKGKTAGGQIYSYELNNLTYLKNVSITNSDDISIAEHFGRPELNGKVLRIPVVKPIEFETGAVYKTIKVKLSKEICDENGISMGVDKEWRYQITEETDSKAYVQFTAVSGEGTVTPNLVGSRAYSIGQKINISIEPSADYQFLRWESNLDTEDVSGNDLNELNNDKICIVDRSSASTSVYVSEQRTELEPAIITAVCVPRLRVISFSPVTDDTVTSVSKDKSIEITFNKSVSDELIKNISITVGGTSVVESFNQQPVVGNKVVFKADPENMISVLGGQTKTVTVSIPADLYYLAEDGTTKVTYGGNGASFSYKIDETTYEKASVSFNVQAGSGTISPAESETPYEYSMEQIVPLSFVVNEDNWIFTGWEITGADGKEVSSDILQISQKPNGSYELNVKKSIQGVTIKPKCSEKLKVTGFTPAADGVNTKDSQIEITFNKNLDSNCSSLLNKINISSDSVNYNSYYSPSISNNKIIIENTTLIPVEKGITKEISVTIPDSLYYYDGSYKVTLGAVESHTYKVDYTTKNRSSLKFNIADSSISNQLIVNDVYLSKGTKETYNIGETIVLEYPLTQGQKFIGWKLEDISEYTLNKASSPKGTAYTEDNGYMKAGTITLSKAGVDYLTISTEENSEKADVKLLKNMTNGATITCGDSTIFQVSKITPEYYYAGYNCDGPVQIRFSKSLNATTITTTGASPSLSISYDGRSCNDLYSFFIENDLVVLSPKANDIYSFMENNKLSLADFIITFDTTQIKATDGFLLEMENNTWTHRINSTKEQVKPEIKKLDVYKPSWTNGVVNASEFVAISSLDKNSIAPSTLGKTVVSQNHINNELFFNCVAGDSGSGLKQITVKEKLLVALDEYTKEIENPKEYTKDYTVKDCFSEIAKTGYYEVKKITNNKEYNTSFDSVNNQNLLPYVLKSEKDGLVQIEIVVEDYAGNTDTATYYVHKDTQFQKETYITPGERSGSYMPLSTSVKSSGVLLYDELSRNEQFEQSVQYKLSTYETSFYDYYYQYNNYIYYNSSLNYAVNWGYSFDDNMKSMNEDRGLFTLNNSERTDIYKDVCLEFCVTDEVGNTGKHKRVIPGKTNLLGVTKVNDGTSSSGEKQWKLEFEIADFDTKTAKAKAYGADYFGCFIVYRYKEKASDSFSSYRKAINTIDKKKATAYLYQSYSSSGTVIDPTEYRPLGYYEFYALPFYHFQDRFYWGSLSDPVSVTYTDNTTGPVVSSSSVSASSPSSMTAKVVSKPLSYGFHTVQITASSFTRTSGYSYYIWYDNGISRSKIPFNSGLSLTFDLPSCYTYGFGIYAEKNTSGTNYHYESSEMTTLDCTYDNVPPRVLNKEPHRMHNYSKLSNGFQMEDLGESQKGLWSVDDGVGLKTDSSGNIILNYYFIPSNTNNYGQAVAINITADNIENYAEYKRTIKYKSTDTYLFLPYTGLIPDLYTLCIAPEDKNGNITYYSCTFLIRVTSNNHFSFTHVTNGVKISNNVADAQWESTKCFGYCYFSDLDMTKNQWGKAICKDPSSTTSTYPTKGSYNPQTFVRLVHFGNQNSKYETYWNPVYFYGPYYSSLTTDDELVCDSKALITGNKVCQIFYDNPMFVHTMYYQDDLGEDAGLWEGYGTEISIVSKTDCHTYKVEKADTPNTQKSFSYLPDLTKVTAGYYYVSIAHFADGTVIMSDVKRK